MSSILDDFGDCMIHTATVYNSTNTKNSLGQPVKTWALLETITNIGFYEGRSAESIVSEKIKAEIDAVAIINPQKITNPIKDDYRIDVNGRSFAVVHSDDIAKLNEVLAIGLKEWTTNVS
jgi:head-tail adaptor